MARRSKPKAKKPNGQYEHKDKKRMNNPPVGLRLALCLLPPLLLVICSSGSAAAQPHLPDSLLRDDVAEESSSAGWKGAGLSLRDHPDLDPEWFLVSDVGLGWRLNDGRERGDDDHAYTTIELGLMRYKEDVRLGMGLLVGFEPGRERFGIQGMTRTRLSHDLNVQVSYGLLLGGDNRSVDVDFPGATVQVELRYLDFISASVRGEAVRIETPESRQTDVAWFLGLKAGSYAGLGALALRMLASMADL